MKFTNNTEGGADWCRFCGNQVTNLHRPSVRQQHEAGIACTVAQRRVRQREDGYVATTGRYAKTGGDTAGIGREVARRLGVCREIIDRYRMPTWGKGGTFTSTDYIPEWLWDVSHCQERENGGPYAEMPGILGPVANYEDRRMGAVAMLEVLCRPALEDEALRAALVSAAIVGGSRAVWNLAKEANRGIHKKTG